MHMFDNENHISKEWIISKGFCSVVIPSSLNLIYSEWISLAIKKNNYIDDVLLLVENISNEFIASKIHEIENDTVYKFSFENISKKLVITNKDQDFAVFRNEFDEYLVVCGSKDFVKDTFLYSSSTLLKIFDAEMMSLEKTTSEVEKWKELKSNYFVF